MNITFRPMNLKDVYVQTKWLKDPEVRRYLGPSKRNGVTLLGQLKRYRQFFKVKSGEYYIIEVDQKPIGQVALTVINNVDKNAGVYILLGDKKFWGQGIGKKAMLFIINRGFNELKLHKLYLEAFAENSRAINLYKSFGFKLEGTFVEQGILDGKFSDEIRMGLINPR